MSKLLSDGELERHLGNILGWNYDEEGWYEPSGDERYSCSREMSELRNLIQSQKQAAIEDYVEALKKIDMVGMAPSDMKILNDNLMELL